MEFIDMDGNQKISIAELAFFLDPKGESLSDYFTSAIRKKVAEEMAEERALADKELTLKKIAAARNREFKAKGMPAAPPRPSGRNQMLRTPKLNLYANLMQRPCTSPSIHQGWVENPLDPVSFAWTGVRRQPKLPNFTRSRKKNGHWKSDFERYEHSPSKDLNLFCPPVQQPASRMRAAGW